MSARWLDVSGSQQGPRHIADFWSAMRLELHVGEFWADRIKAYRGDPGKRLHMALDHLPLPHAFKEGAAAARALIRERRKAGQPFEEQLSLLYWLAAIRSFMLDYAPRLREPGYNVVESIPGKEVCSLPFAYRDLGYRELILLNQTDRKWLVETWGEPAAHTTLNAFHRDVWDRYEGKLVQQREQEAARFQSELDSLLR